MARAEARASRVAWLGRGSGRIALRAGASAGVHGATPVWGLPALPLEEPPGGRRGALRVEPAGDVHHVPEELVEEPISRAESLGAEVFELDALASRRARGELLVSPAAARAIALEEGRVASAGVDDWEVVPGLRMLAVRTPTLPPATTTNVFLVGHTDLVLVEPAPVAPEERARVLRWVEAQRGPDGRPPRVSAILATHHHPDHVGGARELCAGLGVELHAHPLTGERLKVPSVALEEGAEFAVDDTLRLECVHTPGHAPGHLCFREPRSGVVLVGDMVAGVGTIVVDPREGDMADYLASLARLRALAPRWLLPAHGGVIVEPRAHLDRYVEHRLDRERRVLSALGTEACALDALVERAYADVPPRVWPLARLSLRAHLDKLVREGRARCEADRWRRA